MKNLFRDVTRYSGRFGLGFEGQVCERRTSCARWLPLVQWDAGNVPAYREAGFMMALPVCDMQSERKIPR